MRYSCIAMSVKPNICRLFTPPYFAVVQEVLLPLVNELHSHPRVRLLLTTRVQLGADMHALRLAALSQDAAVALVLDSVISGVEKPYRWERWQAQQLAEQCNCNALLLSIVTGLVAAQRCTLMVSMHAHPLHESPNNLHICQSAAARASEDSQHMHATLHSTIVTKVFTFAGGSVGCGYWRASGTAGWR